MKNKKLAALFLIIIVIDALVAFLWFYLYSQIGKEKDAVKKNIQDAAIFEINVQNLKTLERQIGETENEKRILDSAFVSREDIVPFIDFMEKLGLDVGVAVEFTSVKFDGGKNENPRLQFKMEGNFKNIFRYIVLLENLPSQAIIEGMDMNKKENDDIWKADIGVILAGYMPEKK